MTEKETKTLRVSKETHKRLRLVQIEGEYPDMDTLLKTMLDKSGIEG